MLFTKKDLKDKQEELKEMGYLEHLEETGEVAVNDLSMDEVDEIEEVLVSLNYITRYENDYLILENVEEKKVERTNN